MTHWPTADPHVLLARLQELRREYVAQLPDKLAQIEALAATPAADSDLWRQLHRALHSLAGSGSTYGCPTVGDAAREAVVLVHPATHHAAAAPDPHDLSRVIAALRRAVATDIAAARPLDPGLQSHMPQDRSVVVVSDHADELVAQLAHFGYGVRVVSPDQAGSVDLMDPLPAALVLDLEGFGMTPVGIAAIALMRAQLSPPPLIFVAAEHGLRPRLAAVRAGGDACFSVPVDVAELVETLDRLTGQRQEEPYRILLIEDSPTMARLFAAILQHAGMQTLIVSDPLELEGPLDAFQPDLVLMDLYMPGCTGQELAAVIRQQNAFVSLPIVFLSGETNRDLQLAALHQGGDDFLTKPIAPHQLIAAVTSRVERARRLRAQLIRDSLTGLLNHTAAEGQLERELARARRANSPLAVAMVDIDHFKSVNDTYGHPAGDRVLRSMARLLQQRLRRSDLVGRYGGEEFIIILPDTGGEQASLVLERIRESAAQLRYQADHDSFRVTISAGIAVFPTNDNPLALVAAADTALYQAKAAGRNRVILTPPA
jgi:diguanylate cyclase (GGDEF)-like protein